MQVYCTYMQIPLKLLIFCASEKELMLLYCKLFLSLKTTVKCFAQKSKRKKKKNQRKDHKDGEMCLVFTMCWEGEDSHNGAGGVASPKNSQGKHS